MKKLLLPLTLFSASIFATKSFAVDISPSNISENTYYRSYDAATKTIKGVHVTILTDGSNSNNRTGACVVKMYLLKAGTTTNPTYVHTIDVSNGFAEMSSREFAAFDIDLSKVTPALPSGDYRLGVFADANEQVTETNESNNAILLEGTISYTAGAVVTSKPDLVVESCLYTYQNKVLTIENLKISNKGTGNAAASDIEFLVEGDGGFLSFTESIDAIPAGETLTINPDPFDLSEVPDGITLSLKLIADPDEEVEESDEANNEKLITSDISLTTGLDEVLVSVSNRLKIAGNEIEVNLPENNEIELSVYDINGNLVSNVFKGSLTKGIHRFAHTMKSNALYFCRLSNGSGSITKKIVLQ